MKLPKIDLSRFEVSKRFWDGDDTDDVGLTDHLKSMLTEQYQQFLLTYMETHPNSTIPISVFRAIDNRRTATHYAIPWAVELDTNEYYATTSHGFRIPDENDHNEPRVICSLTCVPAGGEEGNFHCQLYGGFSIKGKHAHRRFLEFFNIHKDSIKSILHNQRLLFTPHVDANDVAAHGKYKYDLYELLTQYCEADTLAGDYFENEEYGFKIQAHIKYRSSQKNSKLFLSMLHLYDLFTHFIRDDEHAIAVLKRSLIRHTNSKDTVRDVTVDTGYWFVGIVPSKYHHAEFEENGGFVISASENPRDTTLKNYKTSDNKWLFYHVLACDSTGRFWLHVDLEPNVKVFEDLIAMANTSKSLPEWTKDLDHNTFLHNTPTRGAIVPSYIIDSDKLQDIFDRHDIPLLERSATNTNKNPVSTVVRRLNSEINDNFMSISNDDSTEQWKRLYETQNLSEISLLLQLSITLTSSVYNTWRDQHPDGVAKSHSVTLYKLLQTLPSVTTRSGASNIKSQEYDRGYLNEFCREEGLDTLFELLALEYQEAQKMAAEFGLPVSDWAQVINASIEEQIEEDKPYVITWRCSSTVETYGCPDPTDFVHELNCEICTNQSETPIGTYYLYHIDISSMLEHDFPVVEAMDAYQITLDCFAPLFGKGDGMLFNNDVEELLEISMDGIDVLLIEGIVAVPSSPLIRQNYEYWKN